MGLLDNILNNILENSSLDKFSDKTRQVRLAEQNEQRQTGRKTVDIFKENEAGEQVRLERPAGSPLTGGERLGLERENTFSDFMNNEDEGGFNILKSLGQITGFGSDLWKSGLDIDLKVGDIVPSPVSGTVEFAGPRGGFGNQVRVRGNDGRSYWLSHLQAPNVSVGQQIKAGQAIGTGGKTGNVIPGPGGDGSHLDLTVQDKNDKLLGARQVNDLLNTFG